MLCKILMILMLLLIAFGLSSCEFKKIDRYDCQNFKNWDSAECNPPYCLKTRICTVYLYPSKYWEKVDLKIYPISYSRIKVQVWIQKGIVDGLTLEQYIDGQNLRYIEALKNNDQLLIDKLKQDADRVGYYLIPSKFLGGGSTNE